MDLLLIRHGQSQGNVAGLLNSTPLDPLTEVGIEQAAFLKDLLAELNLRPDYIVTSPWTRAVQTTDVIFGKDSKRIVEPRLGETDPGRFAQWKASDFREKYPDFGTFLSDRHEEGESHLELAARCIDWLEQVFLRRKVEPGLMAVVCHAGPVSVISQYLLSIPLSLFPMVLVPNASLTMFRYDVKRKMHYLEYAGKK